MIVEGRITGEPSPPYMHDYLRGLAMAQVAFPKTGRHGGEVKRPVETAGSRRPKPQCLFLQGKGEGGVLSRSTRQSGLGGTSPKRVYLWIAFSTVACCLGVLGQATFLNKQMSDYARVFLGTPLFWWLVSESREKPGPGVPAFPIPKAPFGFPCFNAPF